MQEKSDFQTAYFNDPLGNVFVLTETRWKHIRSGHDDDCALGLYHAMGETITDPDAVYRSASSEYPNRRVYFRRNTSATFSPEKTTKVVCSVSRYGTDPSEVITAFSVLVERGNISECIYKRS